MANNYYDATGVLVLRAVTPVITALFGGFNLDASYPGDGEAYIARISEDTNPSWDEVFDCLKNLADTLSIPLTESETGDIRAVLKRLSEHFNCAHDAALGHFINQHPFDDEEIDLDSLFTLATRFDDGHGLTAIRWEGAWHCSKPRLFEFGGDGFYLSRDVFVHSDSSQALSLGPALYAALYCGNLDQVASLFKDEVCQLTAGLRDHATRRKVRLTLAELLLQQNRSPDSGS